MKFFFPTKCKKSFYNMLFIYFAKLYANRQHFHHAHMPGTFDFLIFYFSPQKKKRFSFIFPHFRRIFKKIGKIIFYSLEKIIKNCILDFPVIICHNEQFLQRSKIHIYPIMMNLTGCNEVFWKQRDIPSRSVVCTLCT